MALTGTQQELWNKTNKTKGIRGYMRGRRGFFACTLAVALLVTGLVSLASAAALNSNQQSVTLTATAPESLTIALTGTTVTWAAVVPGANSTDVANQGSGTVGVTTTWRLKNGHTSLLVYAFFTSAPSAMVHGDPLNTVDIPSSAVMVKGGDLIGYTAIVGNPPGTALGPAVPAVGATATVRSINITGANKNGTDTLATPLSFALDLSSAAMSQLPSDTYTGTLYIQAQATP
jgi:hypothetical protein